MLVWPRNITSCAKKYGNWFFLSFKFFFYGVFLYSCVKISISAVNHFDTTLTMPKLWFWNRILRNCCYFKLWFFTIILLTYQLLFIFRTSIKIAISYYLYEMVKKLCKRLNKVQYLCNELLTKTGHKVSFKESSEIIAFQTYKDTCREF